MILRKFPPMGVYETLFKYEAGILPGRLCDMLRRDAGEDSLQRFIRFSFGPLSPASFEDDMSILRRCVSG